jgi:hypothetical protein
LTSEMFTILITTFLNSSPPSFCKYFNRLNLFQATVEVLEVKDIYDKKVKVVIKLQRVAEVPLNAVFEEYERFGSKVDKPQDQISALNIILGTKANIQNSLFNYWYLTGVQRMPGTFFTADRWHPMLIIDGNDALGPGQMLITKEPC